MFVIYDKNMNIKEFPNGAWPLDIFISSISKKAEIETIEGRPGNVTKGVVHQGRFTEAVVGLRANDTEDYDLLRDEVYALFDDDEFYISKTHQKGKRYKFNVVQSYVPERLSQRMGRAQFILDIVDLPYAESIGTTQDIQRNGINADDGLWGYGMGLIADDDSLIYTHTGKTFKIYNAGNVEVHPFHQDLKITISNVTGSTSFFELKNTTNNTTFRVNEAVANNQTIILDGPVVTRNGLSYLRQTNKQFIELAPGWNEFEINGADSAKVEFDFRFYYR